MTKTILAVLAHPDDESFGLGGTLALYAQKGYDTYLVCATRGEAGTVDASYLNGFKDTAELRTGELLRAAKILGLRDVFFLGYRDSGMVGSQENLHPEAQINHPVEEVAGKVVKYIRELKPDIVITFDPIGGYKHPDHIHIQKATVLAFEKADDASFHPEAGAPFKPRALYYQVFSRRILRWTVRLMPLFGKDPTRFGQNADINLKELAEVDFPVHARLDVSSVSEIKKQAGAQHASQGGVGMRQGVSGFLTRLFGEKEEFMRAYPPIEKERYKIANDLFLE
ncbi:MAG TPA: PIG-L family deacetylase [Anaerolineales bacterium]|jgi:N-acetyl-1-D-myo-inositol-2-amino-2-deoxy-alpha-D-glucopyranoside deacetylase/mycothiol S-conjugate amidase|nr:PIG-L family deacetylase [Anaerolineales bacterium]